MLFGTHQISRERAISELVASGYTKQEAEEITETGEETDMGKKARIVGHYVVRESVPIVGDAGEFLQAILIVDEGSAWPAPHHVYVPQSDPVANLPVGTTIRISALIP